MKRRGSLLEDGALPMPTVRKGSIPAAASGVQAASVVSRDGLSIEISGGESGGIYLCLLS